MFTKTKCCNYYISTSCVNFLYFLSCTEIKNDKLQKGRHGFPLGTLTEWQLASAKRMLPQTEYFNPSGFKEKWEIRKVGKETILFIPQQYLAEQGKAFPVTGSFIR